MTEDSLGGGIYLDKQLDFGLNTTGDIRTTDGSEELEKDLSFQLIIILDDLIGQPLTPQTRSQIKSRTVDTVLSDTRVEAVDRSSFQVVKPDEESIRLQMFTVAGGEEQELVFNL